MHEAAIDHYGATQRRMLELLLSEPGGLSVERLASDLGISQSAVRQHLGRLERDGLVARTAQQPTRGRPEQLHTLTTLGREAFPRRYRELAEKLIGEVAETLGAEKLDDIMQRLGSRAGKEAAAGSGGRADLDATASAMLEAGYDATLNPDDASEIVARNCVFHHLAARFPSVCQYDLAFLENATGRKVEHRECMVRGGTVCRFGFKPKK